MHIYIDMDGVLAKWDTTSHKEDTHMPGYFRAREPEQRIIDLIRLLTSENIPVTILSAAYDDGHSAKDKEWWLEHIAGLQDIPAIFVPYGQKKSDYVQPARDNILLDDYTKNLLEWELAGNTGVKYFNGINGNHHKWQKIAVNRSMSGHEICTVLCAAV